jgi:hypothetical protein
VHLTCFKTTILCAINHGITKVLTQEELTTRTGEVACNQCDDIHRPTSDQNKKNSKRNKTDPKEIRNSYCEEESGEIEPTTETGTGMEELNRNWTERGTKTRTRGTKTRTGTVELERIGLKRNPKKVSIEVEEPLEEIIIHRVSRSI